MSITFQNMILVTVASAVVVALAMDVADAHSRRKPKVLAEQSLTKTVPEAATLEYRVKGQLVQSLPVQPGTYRITVQQLN